MPDGSGVGVLYPPMTGSSYVKEGLSGLPCIIRMGKKGSLLKNVAMPGIKNLTEAEMFNLVNYIADRWGNRQQITLTELRSALENCKE